DPRVAANGSWLPPRYALSRRLRLSADGNYLQPFREVHRVSGADRRSVDPQGLQRWFFDYRRAKRTGLTMVESSQNVSPTPETPAAEQTATTQDLRFSAEGGQPFEIPILALQNLTLFPETVVPLGVGRPRSVAAVEASLATPEKLLGCITARPDRADDTDTRKDDLYEVGTLVMIKRMERSDDGMRLIVQGTERIRVREWKHEDPYLRAVVEILPEPRIVDADQVEAGKRNLQQMITEALALLPNVPP